MLKVLPKTTLDLPQPKEEIPALGRSYVKVSAVWALVVFGLINLLLWLCFADDKKISKDLWSGAGSIDLALNDLEALKTRPQVVLLGSSLMMYPFWAMDKEMVPTIPDIFHHHVSFVLEDCLKRAGWSRSKVFSLAIFGQMVSDAYIYANEYLVGQKKPDWLIFGLAPRDFSDHDLPAPMATMSFKRLVGLANLGHYWPLYLPGWQDKADFLASHLCFFYGKRWRLQHELDKALEKTPTLIGLRLTNSGGTTKVDRAAFMLAGTQQQRWTNSTLEYRRRYRNIGEQDLRVQMGFLDRLLLVCRQRDIKVLLVNMPLTDVNRSLFPQGFYDSFRGRIKETADREGVSFLDLGDSKEFVHSDFWDTTHLNHFGGHKLIKNLLPILKGKELTIARGS